MYQQFGWTLIAVGLTVLVGCDIGTYDKRSAERLDALNQNSQLAGYLRADQWTQIPDSSNQGTGILIRHPSLFVQNAKTMGPQELSSLPNRAKPPGIDLAGFSYSMEQFAQNSQQEYLSFYVYHWIVPADSLTHDEMLGQITEKVQTAMPELRLRWEENLELPSPSGGAARWSRMKLLAGQPFAIYPAGSTEIQSKQMDGHLIFAVHSTPRFHVIMGWRVPTDIAGELDFLKAADASMGTIKQAAAG